MIRTQVYLTEHEKKELTAISLRIGKKQSELIRDAIDNFIKQFSPAKKEEIFNKTAGMWKDHKDLPDSANLRREWDRELDN